MSAAFRLRVYLDTSVVSAYFDARQPQRMQITRAMWEALHTHQPVFPLTF